MKRLPWALILCAVLGGYLYADLYVWSGPLMRLLKREASDEEVATVHAEKVTLRELQNALRHHLWRHNLSWDTLSLQAQKDLRWRTVEFLVDQRLIREKQQNEEVAGRSASQLAATEFDLWSRQFEPTSDRDLRLGWQQLSAKDMQTRMQTAQAEQAWLEKAAEHESQPVSEEALRAWFGEHRESMRLPEALHAAHLFLAQPNPIQPSRETEIRALREKLSSGAATFGTLSAQASEDPRTKNLAGDLGWFSSKRMPEDFMKAVEKLQSGQTSVPFRTKLGWHIVKMLERRPGRLPEFEEVRSEIQAMLVFHGRQKAIQAIISELRADPVTGPRFVSYRPELIDKALPSG